MGLASALSTALTGLNAAETTIDVVGNNLANSSTVGFKASSAQFATQFLQTRSLGSGPTGNSGGTNPRQIGLGTQVAEITPDFTQGTVQISANPSDLAIQGDGFFMIQGTSGETLYTRNGLFKTNSANELVTVTGDRLLGFGIDSNYAVQTTTLQPLTVPLGTAAVAQATRNAVFEGTLTPTGDLADTSGIIQSGVLGAGEYDQPLVGAAQSVTQPPVLGAMAGAASGAGPLGPGTYSYKVVFVDANGRETPASTVSVNLAGGPNGVNLTAIPTDASGDFVGRRIYRSVRLESLPVGVDPTYYLVKDITDNTTTSLAASAFGTDATADATLVTGTQLDDATLTGNYSYYVTFIRPGVEESRPSPLIGPRNVTAGRITLSDFPTPTGEYAGGQVRIYRNLSTDSSTFYRVAEVDPGEAYTDYVSDTTIRNAALPGYKALDPDGPKVSVSTLLINVVQRDGNTYRSLFEEGELSFTGRKGGRLLAEQNLTITSTTTVQDLIEFMNQSLGIQPSTNDPITPIVGDASGTPLGGAVLASGRLQFVSNTGVENAVGVSLSSLQLRPTASSETQTPNLNFVTSQAAKGQSAVAELVAYDSLGIPVNVRVTVAMESRNSNSTVYRWYADSSDNQPLNGSGISVGTGTITFDGEGNVVSVNNSTVSVDRRQVSSVSPLEFELDFTQLSGLAASRSTLAASRQDGSGAGTLSSYIIGEDGLIRGVFTNGVTRDLGQIRLARFSNPNGLEQRGENAFAAGVNSGLPVQGNPGEQGIGSIIAGAVELSNTDIGKNLIDLILASTAYRGNTRVVTAAQQLLDELLNLRR